MSAWSDTDKIGFLLTCLKHTSAKPDMREVAKEYGINFDAARMRLSGLKKAHEANGGAAGDAAGKGGAKKGGGKGKAKKDQGGPVKKPKPMVPAPGAKLKKRKLEHVEDNEEADVGGGNEEEDDQEPKQEFEPDGGEFEFA